MAARPAPPPLVVADIPCPRCRQPTGYDAWRRRIFCNYCGIVWPAPGAGIGDELPGQWADTNPV